MTLFVYLQKQRKMADFITYGMTDGYILKILGEHFKQMRINAGYSQQDLAATSGLTRKTVSSIENGKSASTGNVVALLRGLKRLDVLSILNTPVPVSPIAAAKAGKNPQRVRSKKKQVNTGRNEW